MCYYISVILPSNADVDKVRQLAGAHHLALDHVRSVFLEKQLIAGERMFITTTGHCDCNAPIGSAHRGIVSRHSARELADHGEKLRKKGWSQAKIDRWLVQQQLTADRRTRIREDWLRDGVPGVDAPLTDWLAFIQEVTASRASENLAILLQMYHGAINDEQFSLKGRREFSVANVTVDDLANIQEDVVYHFNTNPHVRRNSSGL